MERLQKRIAECGVASRRKAEELIAEGRVMVNGKIITEMGYQVTEKDEIKVDGNLITKVETKIYLAMYKPQSIITSVSDDKKRKTIIDILPDELKQYRLFPVGRLDYDTRGIILLTNDGEFMNLMVGPTSGVEKEYLARVEGIVTFEELSVFYRGIIIDHVKYLPAYAEIVSIDKEHNSSLVKLVITEGRNHQVKNMFQAIHHPVKKLTRIRFGNITIDKMQSGDVRYLTVHEVKQLVAQAKQEKNLRKRA